MNKWAAAISTAVMIVVAGAATAQDNAAYPARPVRMVIHIGPGSSMDIIGRVLGQKLTDAWGQPVIVDNRAGAGGTIRIVKSPDTRERFASLGADAEGTTPSEFQKYFRGDIEKWAKVVKAAKLSAE